MNLYQLIEDCKSNSLLAQQEVYRLYAPSMYMVCKRYLKNIENAEDTVAIGFSKFFGSISSFRYFSDGETSGWIKKIMVNECLTLLRTRSPFTLMSIDELDKTASQEHIISGISAREILEMITQLPAGCRTVFNLYAIEELSHKEISKVLKISLGTCHSQFNRARQLLIELLKKSNVEYEKRRPG